MLSHACQTGLRVPGVRSIHATIVDDCSGYKPEIKCSGDLQCCKSEENA